MPTRQQGDRLVYCTKKNEGRSQAFLPLPFRCPDRSSPSTAELKLSTQSRHPSYTYIYIANRAALVVVVNSPRFRTSELLLGPYRETKMESFKNKSSRWRLTLSRS